MRGGEKERGRKRKLENERTLESSGLRDASLTTTDPIQGSEGSEKEEAECTTRHKEKKSLHGGDNTGV